MKSLSVLVLLLALVPGSTPAQDPYPGLTIISLRTTTDSYLIDMDLNVVKTWHGAEVPTEFAYMLPDSSVLRPCRVPEAEGRGGRIQRIDANDRGGLGLPVRRHRLPSAPRHRADAQRQRADGRLGTVHHRGEHPGRPPGHRLTT